MKVIKRDGTKQEYNPDKIFKAIEKADIAVNHEKTINKEKIINYLDIVGDYDMSVEEIQDKVELALMKIDPYVAKAFILYREKHKNIRNWVKSKEDFIEQYKLSNNTANATIDDNSNVSGKNIGILNAEIHKSDNILINRAMVEKKLQELFPNFDSKNYSNDLNSHIIYKHDESGFAGAIAPYCCSITMYPFLLNGIKSIGGLSAFPKNLDSFCGMYINLIFATSAQFAGAVATSEFLLYFDYFARKEWGDDYYLHYNLTISSNNNKRVKTIRSQIHQHFQQVIYSINQPAAARGMQAAFVNFSYFDKPFFEGMFGDFYFPDNTKPKWESLNWLQKEFMQWFNNERLRTIITFPVESFALVYKNGKFVDEESAKFVAEEYARGHSFFTYISDTVDSLSSCCFSKDTKVLWKSSTKGVNLTTLEELHNLNSESDKKNLRIFHNGSWIKGKSIKLESRKMYKVTTINNKEYYMTDNHINVTLNGEVTTDKLSINDYLMFNTQVLNAIPENDEHLTYEMGFVVGSFLGNGSFGSEIDGFIHDINFSQNKDKVEKCMKNINLCAEQMSISTRSRLNSIYNNVCPVHISSKKLVEFIQKWTLWERGTSIYNKKLNLNCLLQSVEFRKGILDGLYNTDGGNSNRYYTTSKELVDCMEILISSLGMNSVINVSERTIESVNIRGIEYNRNYPLYCVKWYEPSNHIINKDQSHSWIKRNNSIYFKVKSIEEVEYNDFVYCIECNNIDEPYFTLPSGLITHNCRLKNKITAKEFNFTNGNIGIQTGSKSVITLNLNRIIQNYFRKIVYPDNFILKEISGLWEESEIKTAFKNDLINILKRVYKYHSAYNSLLHDMYNANLLPVYKAGFINLNKQYLTIGINGLNQAAEFLGIKCTDNIKYQEFCQFIFSIIKEQNTLNKSKSETYNTECVPAESLAIKNYNWDLNDNYWVPKDTNLYASYIFKPNDKSLSVLDKMRMHGKDYIGDYLDGGSACHINLEEHLSTEQYFKLLEYAANVGCQYFTFNIPNSECENCGFISKQPLKQCPKCGSENISLWDRVIGYLTKIKNWSTGRQKEQKTRVYSNNIDNA